MGTLALKLTLQLSVTTLDVSPVAPLGQSLAFCSKAVGYPCNSPPCLSTPPPWPGCFPEGANREFISDSAGEWQAAQLQHSG